MTGLPIVFIPGLTCTGRLYHYQTELLGQSHPILLANHWSAASMGEIAEKILAVAPERFALAGTSMGGYVAFEILRRAAARVEKLVLMSTSARPDTPERSHVRQQQLEWTRHHGMRAGTKALWDHLVHPTRHEDHALLHVFVEMAEIVGIEGFARQTEAIIGRADSRPLLDAIKVPTLVIAGADDKLIPPDQSTEIAAGIAGAKLEIVPHCGHMGMIEKPDTYNRLLSGFLS